MEKKLIKQVNVLKACILGLILFNSFILLSAFDKKTRREKFEEIDVERINIVGVD